MLRDILLPPREAFVVIGKFGSGEQIVFEEEDESDSCARRAKVSRGAARWLRGDGYSEAGAGGRVSSARGLISHALSQRSPVRR